jgi:hypothetical protein
MLEIFLDIFQLLEIEFYDKIPFSATELSDLVSGLQGDIGCTDTNQVCLLKELLKTDRIVQGKFELENVTCILKAEILLIQCFGDVVFLVELISCLAKLNKN